MYNKYEYMKIDCAALAFHKSLIGLSQLDALEKTATANKSFYGARSIFVYYTVYHLFAACMLIAPSKYVGKLKMPDGYGEVKDEDIDNPSETPKQWVDGDKYEQDFATVITHSRVKHFCENLRNSQKKSWKKEAPYLIPLYDYFVNDINSVQKCIPGLYEKLCYVRNRVIYRPSYLPTASGRIVQTSAQLGNELRSLPNAEDLYQAITEVYNAIINYVIHETDSGACKEMIIKMWTNETCESLDTLCKLGHQRAQLERLASCDTDNRYSFSVYILHMLEMESMDFVLTYKRKYWKPFEEIYNKTIGKGGN